MLQIQRTNARYTHTHTHISTLYIYIYDWVGRYDREIHHSTPHPQTHIIYACVYININIYIFRSMRYTKMIYNSSNQNFLCELRRGLTFISNIMFFISCIRKVEFLNSNHNKWGKRKQIIIDSSTIQVSKKWKPQHKYHTYDNIVLKSA